MDLIWSCWDDSRRDGSLKKLHPFYHNRKDTMFNIHKHMNLFRNMEI